METVYKLTRPDRTTYNGFYWEPDREYTFPGKGQMCTSAYAYAYRTPLLAVLFNPIHAAYDPALLFEAKGVVEQDDGTKLGLTRLILPLEPCVLPTVTTEQRIAWAIACSWNYGGADWQAWAARWLRNTDRTEAASAAAARAAADWAEAAAWAASAAASWAAARAAASASAWAAWAWASSNRMDISAKAEWAIAGGPLGPWEPESW
jgi:hypothetical protein